MEFQRKIDLKGGTQGNSLSEIVFIMITTCVNEKEVQHGVQPQDTQR